MLDQIKALIQDLDEADLNTLRYYITIEEPERRLKLEAAQEEQVRIVEEVWQKQPDLAPAFAPRPAAATPGPAAESQVYPGWVQPTSMWDSYPPSARVTHDGKAWENVLGRLNAGVPGEAKSGWRELAAEEPAPEVQATENPEPATPVTPPVATPATPPHSDVDNPATGRPPAATPHGGAAATF